MGGWLAATLAERRGGSIYLSGLPGTGGMLWVNSWGRLVSLREEEGLSALAASAVPILCSIANACKRRAISFAGPPFRFARCCPPAGKSLTAHAVVRQCWRGAAGPAAGCRGGEGGGAAAAEAGAAGALSPPPALMSINCMSLTDPKQASRDANAQSSPVLLTVFPHKPLAVSGPGVGPRCKLLGAHPPGLPMLGIPCWYRCRAAPALVPRRWRSLS